MQNAVMWNISSSDGDKCICRRMQREEYLMTTIITIILAAWATISCIRIGRLFVSLKYHQYGLSLTLLGQRWAIIRFMEISLNFAHRSISAYSRSNRKTRSEITCCFVTYFCLYMKMANRKHLHSTNQLMARPFGSNIYFQNQSFFFVFLLHNFHHWQLVSC